MKFIHAQLTAQIAKTKAPMAGPASPSMTWCASCAAAAPNATTYVRS